MSKFDVKIDDSLFQRFLKHLIRSMPDQRTMNRLGLAAIRIIKKRTAAGRDVEGNLFKKYSEGHAKRREKLGLPTHIVNLQMNDIDGMINSMDHLVSRDSSSVLVYLKGSRNRRIARYHNVSGAGKSRVIRKSMGVSIDEEIRLNKLVQTDVRKLIRNLIMEK